MYTCTQKPNSLIHTPTPTCSTRTYTHTYTYDVLRTYTRTVHTQSRRRPLLRCLSPPTELDRHRYRDHIVTRTVYHPGVVWHHFIYEPPSVTLRGPENLLRTFRFFEDRSPVSTYECVTKGQGVREVDSGEQTQKSGLDSLN